MRTGGQFRQKLFQFTQRGGNIRAGCVLGGQHALLNQRGDILRFIRRGRHGVRGRARFFRRGLRFAVDIAHGRSNVVRCGRVVFGLRIFLVILARLIRLVRKFYGQQGRVQAQREKVPFGQMAETDGFGRFTGWGAPGGSAFVG